MTDRPSIEQQRLADVIRPMFACTESNCDICEREALAYAHTIIAAVNDGTCDPLVPEDAAEYPWTLIDTAELAELRALKAKIDGCVVGSIADNEGPWVELPSNDAVLYASSFLAWLMWEASDD